MGPNDYLFDENGQKVPNIKDGKFIKPSEENIKVRTSLYDAIAKIYNMYGGIDAIGLQETMNYEFDMGHLFRLPEASSEQVTYGKGDGGRRGVCTYTKETDCVFETDDVINEICTTLHSYKNKNGVRVRYAFINCYRNQHHIYQRSWEQTVAAIESIRADLRNINVGQVIISGDFNESKKSYPGLREICHPDFYYKKLPSSAPHRIDRVFTNIVNAGFVEVLKSCENVHRTPDYLDVGHKVAILWVGAPPKKYKPVYRQIPKIKKIRTIAKNAAPLPVIDMDIPESDFAYTEELACILTSKIEDIRLQSLTTTPQPRSNQLVLLETVNAGFDAKDAPKDNSAKKNLWNFVSKFEEAKAGLWGKGGFTPRLEDLSQALKDRFASLNQKVESVAKDMMEKNFPLREIEGAFVSNKKKFKQLILSTSNSGACDYLGQSLKMTKAVFSVNKNFRDFLQEISRRCFVGGYFPSIWLEDEITFIYKRKGERTDPKSFRPITISPSLGKHLEKQVQFYLSKLLDANEDNHAYKSKLSCTTAIVHIQKKLLGELNQRKDDRSLGAQSFRWITVFSLDDIEMAFESCENDLICEAVARSFRGDKFKVDKLIGCYFDRRTFTLDRVSGDRIRIQKVFPRKSTPQGSLLSTIFWRVFDGLFSTLYKSILARIKHDKECGIIEVAHGSYADDHFTPIMIKVRKNLNPVEVAKLIRQVITYSRTALKCATEALGCGINPKKSENIVPKFLHEAFKTINASESKENQFAVKCKFKWLGYHLILQDDGSLIFDLEMVKSRLIDISNKRDLLFQYTADIKLKLRIYKTYLAPMVEFFLPTVIQQGENANTIVHRFQHDCLCKLAGACFTVSRQGLERVLLEPGVSEKAIKTARRLQKVCDTSSAQEEFEKKYMGPDSQKRTLSLRSGSRITSVLDTIPAFRRNLVLRINHFATLDLDDAVFSGNRKVEFSRVRSWVKSANNNAKKHALKWQAGKRKRQAAAESRRDDVAALPSLLVDLEDEDNPDGDVDLTAQPPPSSRDRAGSD